MSKAEAKNSATADKQHKGTDGRFAKSFAESCRFSRTSADNGGRGGAKTDSDKALAGEAKAAIIKAKCSRAPVAQLDRASVFGTEG